MKGKEDKIFRQKSLGEPSFLVLNVEGLVSVVMVRKPLNCEHQVGLIFVGHLSIPITKHFPLLPIDRPVLKWKKENLGGHLLTGLQTIRHAWAVIRLKQWTLFTCSRPLETLLNMCSA